LWLLHGANIAILRIDDMTKFEEERYRSLKRTHQSLIRKWRRKKGPCIICAAHEANDKDHLPPKVLFPSKLRTPETEFLTFPVCKHCNKSSSDEDLLLSVALSFWLNQDAIIANREPTDPDFKALYRQTKDHLLDDPKEVLHRKNLLQPFVGQEPRTGKAAIDLNRLPVNKTLTKIIKSIYWLHTDGDILQQYNPGWWIRTAVDTSKPFFISNHLKKSEADLQWGDRFISHFQIGHSRDGVGGLIIASLHFYTGRAIGKGMSWYIIASPSRTSLGDISLYELFRAKCGTPTIEPQE
jgi:hypothetical protein